MTDHIFNTVAAKVKDCVINPDVSFLTTKEKPKSRTGELFIKSSDGEFERIGDVVNFSFDMGDLSYE